MKKLIRTIFFILNLIAAVLLLLSTLAGSIPPSRLVGISILSYAYVAFLILNIAFIIVWLCFSRWEFLLSAAAIVVRFSFIPLFFQVGGKTDCEPSTGTIRVMSFNTHGFDNIDTDGSIPPDSCGKLFLKLIDEEQPDVLCLQEFFEPPKVKVVDSLAARGYSHHYGSKGKSTRSRTILFSRCSIVKCHDMDKYSKFYVDIVKDSCKVRVCCVHLDSYDLTDADIEGIERLSHAKPDSSTHLVFSKLAQTSRHHEAEWLNELQPLVNKTRVPLIVAGDFNDTPASYIYQQATDTLVDCFVEKGLGIGTTYHGLYPAYRIDYILHSSDVQALAYKRVKTEFSDHYPIIASIDLKSKKE